MATGTVKWFDESKGYGFIERQGGPDVFVRSGSLERAGLKSLPQGATVEFELREGPQGPEATNVVVTSEKS